MNTPTPAPEPTDGRIRPVYEHKPLLEVYFLDMVLAGEY